jgi:hypothetical protein
MEDYEGVHSAYVVPGYHDVDYIHLDAEDVATETAFMLVDLSDTTNWPHGETGHLHIDVVDIMFNPDESFGGDIQLGFLANVDADNGDLHVLHTWHFDLDRATMMDHLSWQFIQPAAQTAHTFGPIVADSTLFQTDVNLQGPDGAVSYPSGDGDLVMRIARAAGTIDVSITVGYVSHV